MSKVVLFDIDGTLWNPRKRELLFRAELELRWGIAQKTYQLWLDEYLGGLPDSSRFHPGGWLGILHGKIYHSGHPAEEKELEDLFYDRSQFLAALYPEVLAVLESLREKYTLGCFSQGVAEFQFLKLQLSEVYPLFASEKIYISENKSAPEYLSSLPEAVIVEDRPDVLERLSKAPHLRPIWLKREDSAYLNKDTASRTEDLAAVPTIATLEELPELLEILLSE
jgi:FMN phosphatase YigB (HAD superfamily)